MTRQKYNSPAVDYKLWVDEAMNSNAPVKMPVPNHVKVHDLQRAINKYATPGVLKTRHDKIQHKLQLTRVKKRKMLYTGNGSNSLGFVAQEVPRADSPVTVVDYSHLNKTIQDTIDDIKHAPRFYEGQEVTNGMGEKVRILEIRDGRIIAVVKNFRSGKWIVNRAYTLEGRSIYNDRHYDLRIKFVG